jgi:integrase
VDAGRFVKVLTGAGGGWDAALLDYERHKSVRGDRSRVAARAQGRTLGTAMRDYIANVDKPSSRRAYRTRLPNVEGYPGNLAHMRVDVIGVEDVTTYAKWLTTRVTAGEVAKSSARNAWALVSQTLNAEVLEGRAASNPCMRVRKGDKPKAPEGAESRKAITLVRDAHVEAIAALAPTEAMAVLVRVLYATAMRYSEVLALAPYLVEPQGDLTRLVVERTWAHEETGGGWVLQETKGNNTRVVYVEPELAQAMLALGVNSDGCIDFPPNSTGAGYWADMRDEAGRLGLAPRGVRIHDLRHSRITNLLSAGANIVAVSRMAGHASVEFTLKNYGHVRDEDARALARM